MKIAFVPLIFAAGAITQLSAGSIGMASVSSSAGLPVQDPCQQSASGTSISISCNSFFNVSSQGSATVTIAASFGSLSLTAQASAGFNGSASARASASYDEFLLFGNTSMAVTGEYSVYFDNASNSSSIGFSDFTIKQGTTTFSPPGLTCCNQPIFLTSNYVVNVPMEVSATGFSNPETPGSEYGVVDVNLIGFSTPYVLVTPEPSSILLACIGIGLLSTVARCRR